MLKIIFSLLFAVGCSTSSGTDLEITVSPMTAQEIAPSTAIVSPTNIPLNTTLPADAVNPFPDIKLTSAFPGFEPGFIGERPIFYTTFPDDKRDAVIADQDGSVYRVSGSTVTKLLDISNKISRIGEEEGLLGFAFDPDFSTNRFFYVYYSAQSPRRSLISRFEFDYDLGVADPSSELTLLEVKQPFSNHNGGMLAFGPDGYLYIGVGDGGSRADPMENGQNLETLLGAILRIDVDNNFVGNNSNYSIPSNNPFVGTPGAREEIWAFGIRNPWRFSFDRITGKLWLADVGQDQWEEIDVVESGGNYGWPIMEGFDCFKISECIKTGLEPPVAVYGREDGCSVTGGYVYSGNEIPELKGAYVYGDFCSGNIWAILYVDGKLKHSQQITRSHFPLASFGEDYEGELYAVTFGGIFKLTKTN